MAWWEPHAAFAFAFLLGLWRFAFVEVFVDDTWLNAPSAAFYTRTGLLGPDNWWTQPLKHPLLYVFELVVGQDPAGWRLRSIVLAAAAVMVMMLVARRAFRNRVAALSAAALLCLDPLWLVMSRTTSEDVSAVFFTLLAALFLMRMLDDETDANLLGFALCVGVSFAVRWYTAIPSAVMLGLLLWAGSRRGAAWVARVAAIVAATTLSIYLASYLPWLSRGYSLSEWLRMQIDALRVQDANMAFQGQFLRLAGAGHWLFGSVKASTGRVFGNTARYTVMMNDILIWMTFLPAAVFAAVEARRRKSLRIAVFPLVFVSLYLFFVLSPRRIYLYSAIGLIPFGFLLIGYALGRMPRKVAFVVLALLLAWCVYLLPLTSGVPVPLGAYAWMIRGGL